MAKSFFLQEDIQNLDEGLLDFTNVFKSKEDNIKYIKRHLKNKKDKENVKKALTKFNTEVVEDKKTSTALFSLSKTTFIICCIFFFISVILSVNTTNGFLFLVLAGATFEISFWTAIAGIVCAIIEEAKSKPKSERQEYMKTQINALITELC